MLTGGKKLDGPGNFYEPTVLDDIDINAPVSCEEIFGPVAMLFRVTKLMKRSKLRMQRRLDWVLRHGQTMPGEQAQFVEEIEAGSVFINGMVASDPRLPFGGMKNSGYGRELAEFGIREFVNIKTVWMGESAQTKTETE